MPGATPCPGSGRQAVAGRCPNCHGPADILVGRTGRGSRARLGWHLPWTSEDGAGAEYDEWRALLRRRSVAALQRSVALAMRTQRAAGRAAFLIGRTALMEAGGPPEDRTKALRAFSELELATSGAARVAAEVAAARQCIAGAAKDEPLPVDTADRRDVDFVDSYLALRATAQTAGLAATLSASIGGATKSFQELADAESSTAAGLSVRRALGRVRSAARKAEEVRTRAAVAGNQLARAVGWESELATLVSQARSEAAEDSAATWEGRGLRPGG